MIIIFPTANYIHNYNQLGEIAELKILSFPVWRMGQALIFMFDPLFGRFETELVIFRQPLQLQMGNSIFLKEAHPSINRDHGNCGKICSVV